MTMLEMKVFRISMPRHTEQATCQQFRQPAQIAWLVEKRQCHEQRKSPEFSQECKSKRDHSMSALSSYNHRKSEAKAGKVVSEHKNRHKNKTESTALITRSMLSSQSQLDRLTRTGYWDFRRKENGGREESNVSAISRV